MSSYVSFGPAPDSTGPLIRRNLNFPLPPKLPKLEFAPPGSDGSEKGSFSPALLHEDQAIQKKLLSDSLGKEEASASSNDPVSKREKSMTPQNSFEEQSCFPAKESPEPLPADLENSAGYGTPLQSSPLAPIIGGENYARFRSESPNAPSEDANSSKSSSHSDGWPFSFEEGQMTPELKAGRRPSLNFITPLRLNPSDKESDSIKDGDES